MNTLQAIRHRLIQTDPWTAPAVTLLLELEQIPAHRRPAATVARRQEVMEACHEAEAEMGWLERVRGHLVDAAPVPARQVPDGF